MKMISVTTCSQFSSPADMPASRRTVSKVRRTRSRPVTPGQQGLSLATFLRFLHIRPTARNVASPEPGYLGKFTPGGAESAAVSIAALDQLPYATALQR
jgi:hypothetical protein